MLLSLTRSSVPPRLSHKLSWEIPGKLSDFSGNSHLMLEWPVSSLDRMGVRIHWQMRTIPARWRYFMGLVVFKLEVKMLKAGCI